MRQAVFPEKENLSHSRGTEFNIYAAGTNAGATATKAAVTGGSIKVTDIDGHTDKDALVQILDGVTVIFEIAVLAAVSKTFHKEFKTPLISTVSAAMSAVISASTSDCFVRIGGFTDKID